MIKSESCHFIVAGFFLSIFSVKKNWKKALKRCFIWKILLFLSFA